MKILLLGSGGREHALAWKMLNKVQNVLNFLLLQEMQEQLQLQNVSLNPNDFEQ
jgi:phosphoribosylamine-glycine ligase